MIIEEINKRLDRQVVFSFSYDSPALKFSREHGIDMIVRIRITKTGGYAIMNMENGYTVDEEDFKELDKYEFKHTDDAIMLKGDLTGTRFLKAFMELNQIPSVVVDGIVVHDGYSYVYLRFHSNDQSKVSAVLKNSFMGFERYATQYLGPSTGVIDSFREISDITPLKYVEIGGSVPPSIMNITNDPVIKTLGVSWTREMKYLLGEEIRAIYYDENSLLQEGSFVTKISNSQRIYETSFSNPLIEFFVKQSSENFTITMGMPQKLHGKDFTFSTVVPQIVLPDFFDTVREAMKKFSEWDLDVKAVRDIESLDTS